MSIDGKLLFGYLAALLVGLAAAVVSFLYVIGMGTGPFWIIAGVVVAIVAFYIAASVAWTIVLYFVGPSVEEQMSEFFDEDAFDSDFFDSH